MHELPDTRLQLSPDVLFQEAQGESVLLHLGNERYFGLDPIGTRIWLWLRDGATLPEIHARMLSEYDIEADALARDLLALIDDLIRADLLVPADAPATE